MSSGTADALGLSRAILCNDSLVKKLDELTKAETMYRALIDHAKLVFKSFFDLIQVYKSKLIYRVVMTTYFLSDWVYLWLPLSVSGEVYCFHRRRIVFSFHRRVIYNSKSL